METDLETDLKETFIVLQIGAAMSFGPPGSNSGRGDPAAYTTAFCIPSQVTGNGRSNGWRREPQPPNPHSQPTLPARSHPTRTPAICPSHRTRPLPLHPTHPLHPKLPLHPTHPSLRLSYAALPAGSYQTIPEISFLFWSFYLLFPLIVFL